MAVSVTVFASPGTVTVMTESGAVTVRVGPDCVTVTRDAGADLVMVMAEHVPGERGTDELGELEEATDDDAEERAKEVAGLEDGTRELDELAIEVRIDEGLGAFEDEVEEHFVDDEDEEEVRVEVLSVVCWLTLGT